MGFELVAIGVEKIERGALAAVVAPLRYAGSSQALHQRGEVVRADREGSVGVFGRRRRGAQSLPAASR